MLELLCILLVFFKQKTAYELRISDWSSDVCSSDLIFSAHGSIMIFFVAMAYIVGLMNYVMPLQIGSRDVAFPFLNNLSFWFTFGGAVLFMTSLFVGSFSTAGRSEEHTSELQSLMRRSYAVFCLNKKRQNIEY